MWNENEAAYYAAISDMEAEGIDTSILTVGGDLWED